MKYLEFNNFNRLHQQDKKYNNSVINPNLMNFNAYKCWSHTANLFDILQAMFQINFFFARVFQISVEVSGEVACHFS